MHITAVEVINLGLGRIAIVSTFSIAPQLIIKILGYLWECIVTDYQLSAWRKHICQPNLL